MNSVKFKVTEKDCENFLFSLRWPNGSQCPRCGNREKNFHMKARNAERCSKCRKDFSITSESVLQHLRLPYKTMFIAILLCMDSEKINSIKLSELLKVTNHTAISLMRKIKIGLLEGGEGSKTLNAIFEFMKNNKV